MDSFDRFNRVRGLVGDEGMSALECARVIVFGVGGVGSWTAEALVRSGIGRLTIVDADCVAASNINRQLMATTSTVGRRKVDELRERLLDINPDLEITAIADRFTAENADSFSLDSYDFVVDAIDSLTDKATLILLATRLRVPLVSSMGAALKMDPTRIKVAEFWSVKGCRLAAALRNKFKRMDRRPSRKFKCVYSDEIMENRAPLIDDSGAMTYGKVAINGALCHITSIFGMTLAGLVIQGLLARSKTN